MTDRRLVPLLRAFRGVLPDPLLLQFVTALKGSYACPNKLATYKTDVFRVTMSNGCKARLCTKCLHHMVVFTMHVQLEGTTCSAAIAIAYMRVH